MKCWILKLDNYHLSIFKSCWSLWLDSYLNRWLSIEIYEKQIFSYVLTPIRKCVFRLSFLTILKIYKDYFKGRNRLHKCEAKSCSCKLCPEIEFALVHLSLEESAVFVHHKVLWSMSFLIFILWWTKELCSQHPSQVSDQVTYWDPRIY